MAIFVGNVVMRTSSDGRGAAVLYVPDMGSAVRAWRPGVPGIAEVLHATFTDHAYPMHTHDEWTLLLVDRGGVHYDLHHESHDAGSTTVMLLPPQVPHDGRTGTCTNASSTWSPMRWRPS
jgi:hypothetical protein